MTYRLDTIEIPENNPYENDSLKRKEVVEFLAGLIERVGGPFVLALDSPYGTGKTTLVRMLQNALSKRNIQCVSFDAWQLDYVTDPLIAMVSALDQVSRQGDGKYSGMKKHMGALRKVTSVVAKRGVVAAVKVATLGALDLSDEAEAVAAELAADSATDLVEAFQQESEQLSRFREELKAAIAELPVAGKNKTLVFFIDELDRCRPTFAIELLERVKHLFDVANIVFVLSVDKRQLEASTASVYGSGIDSAEYLRKFIDLEYGLPQVGGIAFTESLLKRFALDSMFASRTGELAHDRKNFVTFFTQLADLTVLSLRVRERCIVRLKLVLEQTPADHFLDPILVAVMIILRMKQPELFSRLSTGVASSDDVMSYLKELPDGETFRSSRSGIVVEAFLISVDRNAERKEAKQKSIFQSEGAIELPLAERKRANELRMMLNNLSQGMRFGDPDLSMIAAKVDIAAGIRE